MAEQPWWQRQLASSATPNHGDVPSWNATLGIWMPVPATLPNPVTQDVVIDGDGLGNAASLTVNAQNLYPGVGLLAQASGGVSAIEARGGSAGSGAYGGVFIAGGEYALVANCTAVPHCAALFGESIDILDQGNTPAAPPASTARLVVDTTGGGKVQLGIRFPTGAVQVIATEP